jgi:hypothetical protein
MTIVVLYNCSDSKCSSLREEDKYIKNGLHPILHFKFIHSFYDLNLQDDNEPLKLNENYLFGSLYGFNPDLGHYQNIYWQIETVEEEQGMLDKLTGNKKISYGGSFINPEISTIQETILDGYRSTIPGLVPGYYKILYIFNSINYCDDFIEYKRKKVSIFDLVANICSLALTIFNGRSFRFNPDLGHYQTISWQIATVEEEQGMLDKLTGNKKISYGGSFINSEVSTIQETIINTYDTPFFDIVPGYYKILYIFRSKNYCNDIIEYKRKKVSVIDLIANICSLALTIFNAFKLGFSILYSSSFDNYKIIDRILSTRDISMEKISKKTEDTKSPLLTELKEIDEENANEYENEKKDKLIEAKKVEENKQSILPKYHFFDFICNIFSCCFKNNNAQKCISACNEIKQKYYSIENILYNQFMMENLLKDYKWNNPDLKFIKNIQLIDRLNYIINDNQT